MKWRMGRRSDNVSDRRGARPGGGFGGGLGGLGGLGGGGLGGLIGRRFGLKGILIVIAIFVVLSFMGIDPMALLNGTLGSGSRQGDIFAPTIESAGQGVTQSGNRAEDELADFTSVVLASTEDTWRRIFAEAGETYRDPTLVMFSGAVQSACGHAQSAMGPFYCPADAKVYIDLSFYRDLERHLQAPGDFAQAYVIAHEVGHHVQNLVGVEEMARRERQRLSEADANALSVRVELQADCFAGIWAYHLAAANAEVQLEDGDIAEGLNAASAIGDDRLQRQSSGRVVPDSFTHGTSEQRMRWFKKGFDSGNPDDCDTFGVATP